MTSHLMPPQTPADAPETTGARIISLLLRGARRRALQSAVREGRLTHVAASDVLAAESLRRLAIQSLWLLVGSAAVYALIIGLSRDWRHTGQLLGDGPALLRLALLVAVNIVGYIVMIPLHEATHALVILALGGRPRFGLKLPLAAYCTAPNQLFLRGGYLSVALAPLVVLSALALVVAAVAQSGGMAAAGGGGQRLWRGGRSGGRARHLAAAQRHPDRRYRDRLYRLSCHGRALSVSQSHPRQRAHGSRH